MRGGPFAGKALVSVALGLGVAACGAAPEAVPKTATIVNAQTIALEDFAPQLSLTGVIEARNETQLAFRVTGQVTQRLVDVGDHVDAGEVLAKIDDAGQQADLAAAQATLDAAKAQVDVAQASFDRQNSLLAQGVTTRSSFDAAQTALQTAQGSSDGAQAQLDTAREALTYSTLTAPAAGVITKRNLEVGEVAQAASPIFVMAEDGPRDALFNVQESAFLGQAGDVSITLALTADPTITAKGSLREISPVLDPETGTVLVKVAIDNPPAGMTLGGSVTGTVAASPTKETILPWSALWSREGEPSVWVIDPQNDTVSLQPVTVKTYQTGSVVIEAGLQPGQVVVTQGGKLLVPGQTVAIAQGASQ
ncbi:MAG: efflux transporter periplasmic adaptor subunit [Devosia sp.]|uniref:efflux RND transporter periplasmic adaptor subunit n=1 Tax=Devosia sp. TaxID=1871048 RepID=UPI0026394639|nr:efflux RND transporter periplasmic adaptor subunit [Devosia sp.]MDB5528407.1 efflux transporter periplasmic adaptor subunit [Devosia sp.]